MYNSYDLAGGYPEDESMNGWGVVLANYNNNKTSYGEILSSINGKDVVSLNETFNCSGYGISLVNAPTIPDTIKYMSNTFVGCENLETAPTIPSSVIHMSGTFAWCTNLTGTIEINANPTVYDYAFEETTLPITLTGSSTMLDELAATANNGNVYVGGDYVTFTLNNIEYLAETGMTYEEWLNSSYNTTGKTFTRMPEGYYVTTEGYEMLNWWAESTGVGGTLLGQAMEEIKNGDFISIDVIGDWGSVPSNYFLMNFDDGYYGNYYVKRGMTWSEFVNSKLNKKGSYYDSIFEIDSNNIVGFGYCVDFG